MRITYLTNDTRKEYFFSNDHCQQLRADSGMPTQESEYWVPVTVTLPHQVVPRACLPDGIVDTLEKYVRIYLADSKEIPNPNRKYIPKYRYIPGRMLPTTLIQESMKFFHEVDKEKISVE